MVKLVIMRKIQHPLNLSWLVIFLEEDKLGMKVVRL